MKRYLLGALLFLFAGALAAENGPVITEPLQKNKYALVAFRPVMRTSPKTGLIQPTVYKIYSPLYDYKRIQRAKRAQFRANK